MPLHLVAMSGNVEIIQLLHKAGANINQLNKEGSSLLTLAFMHQHRAAIDALMVQGRTRVAYST